MGRKMRSRRQRQREFWKGATQQDRYEYLVDSPFAIPEIRIFHEDEERILLKLLRGYVDRKQDTVFVEIGCGPGRIVRRIAHLIIENPATWGRYLKYVVGVDFETGMIKRAIESLTRKEKIIRDWTRRGTAHEIATLTGLTPRKVKEDLRRRIFFVDADANLPFLQCKSLVPVVGIMFGTLGNIPTMQRVLERVSRLCQPNGRALIVAFNRDNHQVGSDRYRILAEGNFRPLYETSWSEEEGAFTSPGGFYSRWFSEFDFRKTLQRYFENEFSVKQVGHNGLCAIVKPKRSLRKQIVSAVKSQKEWNSSLTLLCPRCGHPIEKGDLPLPSVSQISCIQQKHRYSVVKMMGYNVPLLEIENSSSSGANARRYVK